MKTKITLTFNNGKVRRVRKLSLRRFRHFCSLGSWKTLALCTEYGKAKDIYGKTVMFKNEGKYENPTDALQAFIAFTE